MVSRPFLPSCFRNSKHKDRIKQASPLLDLPLELLYEIYSKLPLPAMILFSQTCRDLWYQLRPDCCSAFENASTAERLKCLAALGDILPKHRLCIGCGALRLVKSKDLPLTGYDKFHKPCPAFKSLWSRSRSLPDYFAVFRRPAFVSLWCRPSLLPYYFVAFRHIQLVMENGHYTDVRKIYQAVRLRRFMIYIPRYYSLSLDFTAEASVVHGTLLLLTIFELYPAFGHLSFKALSHTSMGFCPHLRINETTNPEEAENPIMAAIRLAFDVGNDPTKTFSCDFCPTDYSVSRVGQRAIFYVWQEIDSKTSPADPFWPSHATDCKENGRKDAKFEYRHGSIRDMYKNTGTVQCYRPSRKSLWL